MRRLYWWLPVLLLVGVAVWLISRTGAGIESGSWLVVDLEGQYVEGEPPPLQRIFGRGGRGLASQFSELGKAERDERLGGVFLRVRGLDVGWGKAQDLRRAIVRLREKGKRTVAYLELEKYGSNLEYYVASAADAVYVAPGTRSPFVGMATELFFLGGLFEKLGVTVEYERVGKYKTAVDQFAAKELSDSNREMTEAMLDSLHGQFLADVAAARKLTRDEVAAIVDRGPTSPRELQSEKLIDGAAYFDEVVAKENDPKLVEDEDYARVEASTVGFSPQASFALIYGAGNVVTGDGEGGPSGGPVMASTRVAKAFEAAAENADVRAIVFRIDSPGGSALASDLIYRAIRKARAKGKPVVASMSDLAASGGYYVAAAADKIVAEPATLTGSIGVFVIRPMLAGALEKLGIGTAALTRGRYADLLLSTQPLSEGARERMRSEVQGIYQQFVARVAEGRGMEPERVNELGRGRVWTGEQAKEHGLVDELGGLRDAVIVAKGLANIPADADVVLQPFPPPKPLVVQIQEAFQGAAVARADALIESALPSAPRAAFDLLRDLPLGVPVLIPPILTEVR
jgi:protease IV